MKLSYGRKGRVEGEVKSDPRELEVKVGRNISWLVALHAILPGNAFPV